MDIQRVAFQRAFAVNDLSRTQRYATKLYGTFCHRIKVVDERSAEAVQHLMNGNKVCTAHIPVSLFGNQRQVNELDHLAIQQLNGRFLRAISDVVTGIEQIRCFSFNQFCGTHSVISS